MKKFVILLLCGIITMGIIFSGCTTKTEESAQNQVSNVNNNEKVDTAEKTTASTANEENYRTIKDMWNRDVKLKKDINL